MTANDVAWAMWAVPTPGCWDVTLAIGGQTLRFAANAVPADQQAGKLAAMATEGTSAGSHPAELPGFDLGRPAPDRPGRRLRLLHRRQRHRPLRTPDTVYAAGENELQWLPGSDQEPTLTGVRLDAPGTIDTPSPIRWCLMTAIQITG